MKTIRTQKLLAFLLTAVMLMTMLCIVPYTASAADEEEATVYTSGDYDYTVLDDGTAQITKYNGSASELVIPTELDGKTVSAIGQMSFEKCKSITSLTIPSNIKTIGKNAFRYCENLKNLTLSEGLEAIDLGGFQECAKLESVVLPNSLTKVDTFIFKGDAALKSVKLPNNLQDIGDYMFCDTGLTSIEFPPCVTRIGQCAFAHSSLISVEIPATVKVLDCSAFAGCLSLSSVTLNEGLETINGFVFHGCKKLMEVTVPDTVKEVEYLSFGYWFDPVPFNDVLIDGFVLKGYTGSAAERYANGCGVKFVSIGESILTPPTTAGPTEPTEPPVPGSVTTVYYKNTNNFSTPYAYYWQKNGNGPEKWPGVAMTKVTDDVYKVDVPVENNMIIFSNNGGNKTLDLDIPGNNYIYEDSNWSVYADAPTEPVTTEPQETTAPATTEPITTKPQETTAPATTQPDTTEPTETLYGDVNGDGVIEINDATEIQKVIASLVTFTELQMKVGDVNLDGKTDVVDVTLIQKYLASYDVENVGEKMPS